MNTAVEKILEKAQYEIRIITQCTNAKVVVLGLENKNDTALYTEANELVLKCCELWELNINVVRSKSRKRGFVMARHIMAYILKQMYYGKLTYMRMGTLLGYTDHTDFIHAFKKAEDLLEIKDDMACDYLKTVKHLLP